MTLLFARNHSIESSFALKPNLEYGSLDTVLLGKDLWNSLHPTHQATLHQIPISISRHRPSHSFIGSPLQNILCWAIPDNEKTGLRIPPQWLQSYPYLFHVDDPRPSSSQKSLTVTATEPIILTSVVLTALSEEAFHAALSQISFLERWLISGRPIFRQGDVHAFKADLDSIEGSSYNYRVDMVEPVHQGCFEFGKTQLILTLANNLHQVADVLDQSGSSPDAGTESDLDGIEIDEGFFANSVLQLQSDHHQSQKLNHIGDINNSSTYDCVMFHPLSLQYPISGLDNCTLYLRTPDLSRVGVLNGDWGIARSNDVASNRLVRIVADDSLVPTTGVVMGSPILLNNLCAETSSSNLLIFLHGIPADTEIPTANSVTLSIISSPFSREDSYRSIFLDSLKVRLESRPHIVKSGDVIAVGINDSTLRDVEGRGVWSIAEEGSTVHSCSAGTHTNLVGFFAINNIHINASSATVSNEYSLGDAGCWLNSSVTRVIQTGEIRHRIPDIKTYLGADKRSPAYLHDTLQNMSSSQMLSPQSSFGQLFTLAKAALSRRAVDYDLRFSILLRGKRGIGKFTTATWVAHRLGMHVYEVDCYNLIDKDDAKTGDAIQAQFQRAMACTPCCLVLRHIDALAQSTQNTQKDTVGLVNTLQECVKDVATEWKRTGHQILVFGTSSMLENLPVGLQSCFKHITTFEVPSEVERYEILKCLLVGTALAPNVTLSDLATRTAALVASDLANLVEIAQLASFQRVHRASNYSERSHSYDEIPLIRTDFDIALARIRMSYSESIGAPKIPDVAWDDVGGLANVKSDILDTVQLPLDHPELFSDGLKKRSGILLFGPPGTGKTLLAKAVATSCSLNFFSVKGPELLNMYIGESEANVRRVFQQARDAKPCVIFFDELDSVAPKRGNHGDSGGVMDRIVSQLLSELDGMASGKAGNGVFVIGATNRPDLLDAALLRPGRFDRMLYLGVSNTHDDQLNILQALTRKFCLASDVNLSAIAENCPFHFTGADFYALCSDAMLNAMSRKALRLEQTIETLNKSTHVSDHPTPLTPQYYLAEMAAPDDFMVQVVQKDFKDALRGLRPSISQSELDHYVNIQKQFSSNVINDKDAIL